MSILTTLLAYAAAAYILAAAAYLLISARWPTPFLDAVRADPKLDALYAAARADRANLFRGAMLASAAALALWRPLPTN